MYRQAQLKEDLSQREREREREKIIIEVYGEEKKLLEWP